MNSSQSSEEAFVGCVVASEGAVLDMYPAKLDHFCHTGARIVFAAALALYGSGSPVTAFTVSQRITEAQAKEMGGDHKVSEICSFPVSVNQAGYFFREIDGKRSVRKALGIARWITAEAEAVKEPEEFCAELQRQVSGLESESEGENIFHGCIKNALEKLDRMERGEVDRGLYTRLDAWNQAFGGVMKSQLYGIAGRPGTGKTAMMEMLIGDYLTAGIPVAVFEKDMSPQKLIERIAARAAGVPFWRMARGILPPDEIAKMRNMLDLLREAPLHLYSPSNLTAERMCAIARRDIRTKGVQCVFLDHVQALRVGKDLREGLTQASLAIRDNVTTTGVTHIVLAHINRDGAKGGRPKPEHIKEFDQLYGDADGMVLLWSETDPAEQKPGIPLPVNFYVAKNRDGAVSEEKILFDGQHLTFRPIPE